LRRKEEKQGFAGTPMTEQSDTIPTNGWSKIGKLKITGMRFFGSHDVPPAIKRRPSATETVKEQDHVTMHQFPKQTKPKTPDSQTSRRQSPRFMKAPFSLTDRLRSGYHRIWYEASQALRWSCGKYREAPLGTLPDISPFQQKRIEELVRAYGLQFELGYPPETAFMNYGYLDLLDRARTALNWTIPSGQVVCDVGSANFSYAGALHTFFQPTQMKGIEVDGHRVYCNGRSRIDYAQGHIQDLPNTDYVVADYRHYHQSANIITAWYPFVTPQPLLAWRLPLSLFDPATLFVRMANNLVVGGTFVMINHSPTETTVARTIAESVGLVCRGQYVHNTPLRPRTQPAVLTLWQQS